LCNILISGKIIKELPGLVGSGTLYIFNQMSKKYNLKISTDQTKVMAFKGKHLVRSKTEIDGTILEEVKQFYYLGCELSLEGEPDFDKKVNSLPNICGSIRKHLTLRLPN
jgi:hypothetical protein